MLQAREDPYGLTHQLFYVSDFGRVAPPEFPRSRGDVLADVEGLLLRYLDHEDYDITAELLMAWPQLREPWSPTAAFAFRVLADVEDEAGILPCGNVDPDRLATLEGQDRTRYARAASYHTALVMGLLCAVSLRCDGPPATSVDAPRYSQNALAELRMRIRGDRGDWQRTFDVLSGEEQRVLVPMLAHMGITQSLRLQDLRAVQAVLDSAREHGLPGHPVFTASRAFLGTVASALATSAVLSASDGRVAGGSEL
jgi:hypothetical protein